MNFFNLFLQQAKTYFRRIVRKTHNEFSIEDLHNDAWVMALELGDKRGVPIDFNNYDDQQYVMAALYRNKVTWTEKHSRFALRLDAPVMIGDDIADTWGERIPAPLSSDPIHYLLQKEIDDLQRNRLLNSYSQASAYTIVLLNFEHDQKRLSEYLAISRSVLTMRIRIAREIVRIQNSLFDFIEKIAEDFHPQRGKKNQSPATTANSSTAIGDADSSPQMKIF